MKIRFPRMTEEEIPLYLEWAKLPHVASVWFRPEFEPPEAIYDKVAGNGYDEPYLIEIDGRPVGYLMASDLVAFGASEPIGTWSIDLFLAEKLPPGTGTSVLCEFCRLLFLRSEVKKIVVDPDLDNVRAIRCYEKVGFVKRGDRMELEAKNGPLL